MVNYQNGKIYAIRSFKTDEIYIGSTTQKLCQRLQKHKSHKKEYEEGKGRYMTSYKLLEYDDVYIELIENCICNSKEELLKKEGECIRNTKCVNKNIPGRNKKEKKELCKEWYEKNKKVISEKNKDYYEKNKKNKIEKSKEWYEKNKDKRKEYKKEYHEKNKDIIKQKCKYYYEKNKEVINQKVNCPICNLELSKSSLTRHKKRIH